MELGVTVCINHHSHIPPTHHPHPVIHSSPSPCHTLITLTLSYTHHPHLPYIHHPHTTYSSPSPCHTLITLTPPTHHPHHHSSPSHHPLITLTPPTHHSHTTTHPPYTSSVPQWNMHRLTGTTLFLWRPSASEKMRQVRHLRAKTSAVGVLFWCGCNLLVLWV